MNSVYKIAEKINSNIRKIYPLIFACLVIAESLYYGQQKILIKPSQGIHRWRQTDCASFALNYYQHGMRFFHPELHNLGSDHYTTGYGVSEAPILYYFIAILYRIFGPHDYIFRVVNFLIFFLGLFYLFKLSRLVLGDGFYAAFISLIIYTSPVVVYYSSNYLTDITAISLVFMAWYFFISFYYSGREKEFSISMVLLLIAGLLKVTTAINLVVIAGIYFFDIARIISFKSNRKVFDRRLYPFLAFLFVGFVLVTYYSWAIYYNKIHDTKYFSNQILPIWKLDWQGIKDVANSWIKGGMKEQFFKTDIIYLLLIAWTGIIVFFKRLPLFLKFILIVLTAECLAYIILWYIQFMYHDYYTLILMSWVYFSLLGLFLLLKLKLSKVFTSPLTIVVLSIFLLINISFAHKQLDERYYGYRLERPLFKEYFTIKPYIRSLGIEKTDTVISIPDGTNCYTLYLMNRKGYTENNGRNKDSLGIATSVKLGAKYLFINNEEYLQRDYVKPFLKNRIGQYGNVTIYKLK